jgi:hypothetical protein
MTYVLYALGVIGGALLGAGGLYFGYKLSQTRFGRGKTEIIQTIFSRHTFIYLWHDLDRSSGLHLHWQWRRRRADQ